MDALYTTRSRCKVCGVLAGKSLRRWRCRACYEHWKNHRPQERPAHLHTTYNARQPVEARPLRSYQRCQCGRAAVSEVRLAIVPYGAARAFDEPLCSSCLAEERITRQLLASL